MHELPIPFVVSIWHEYKVYCYMTMTFSKTREFMVTTVLKLFITKLANWNHNKKGKICIFMG